MINNPFFSFLNENLKKVYLQESIYNIVTQNQTLAFLFLQFCDLHKLTNYINVINKEIPANNETLDIRWSIQLISNFLKLIPNNDMSYELALHDFFKLNDQTMADIKKYIDSKGEINNRTAHNLSFFIQLFRDEYPGLFYTILPYLRNLLDKIGNDRLYKEVGSNFITFYIDPPIEFLQKVTEIDEQELPTFFQFHNNFMHPELTFSIQKKFSNLYFYPYKIKGIKHSKYFTLSNSSLCKKQHFIDTIFQIANNSFINHKNTELIQKAAKPIFDILPYIIIANQSFIYSDYNQYSTLLSNKQLFDNNSIASNLIVRFQNDFRLLNFLSSQTGDEFCSGDLLINSFPYFLENVLQNTDSILKFSTIRFFSISDKSADNDFDFVRSYGAFHLIFSLFQSQNQLLSNFQLNSIVNQISKLLCGITNAGVQSMVIVDLFSCVFLQDDKGQFICHPFIAQLIIQLLAKFNITPYINGANALFEKRRASRTDASLSAWMNSRISRIYKNIENKNWPLAEKLTLYLPYYRKLYKQAMQADHYLANENDELSSAIKIPVKVNVLLSKQTDMEKLRDVQKKSCIPELAKVIIEKRLKTKCDEASLCSSFIDKNKWQPVFEFALIFDNNFEDSLKNVKKYHDDHIITGISKNLDTFLQYLYNYYRCAVLIDSTTFDSIEDLFTFNFCNAIEGAIIQGKIEWATELTKYVQKDLFSFVFENISFFYINSNFINNICEKFPLEAAALSITSHVEAKMAPKIQKITDFYFNCEMKEEDKEKEMLFESLFVKNDVDFDDVIFSVDHEELFQYMLNKFDNETIASSYYKIFDYVSYVSSFKDGLRLKQIETLHKIHQISIKKKPSEIVIDVKKKNENYFDLLVDYLIYCIPDTDLTIPLCTLFSLSLTNDDEIDEILKKFPNRFHVLLSRFFHVEGILPHLVKYSPKSKLQFLRSISMLPEKVFIDSNIFDSDTIADSYIRYDSQILEMKEEVSILFTDDQLFTILRGTINSKHSSQIFYHLFKFFHNKEKFIDFWSDTIENKLKGMHIDSDDRENKALNYFNSLKEAFNSIGHSKFNRFRSLSKLVERRPFTRYSIPYSFSKLGEEAFKNEMVRICSRTDNVDIMIDISKSFEIDLESFFLWRSRIQLIFGDFEGAIETIEKNELKINKYSNPTFYDSTFDFLLPLSKCPIVNYDNDEKSEMKSFNIFENISKIIEKNKKKSSIPPTQEAMKTMDYLISRHCDKPQSMSLFVSFCQFEEAFNILRAIESKEEQKKFFINNIYFPVIFSNLESQFNDFMSLFDSNLTKTGFLWDAAIHFFNSKQMEYGLMKVYQVENKLENAAIVGFDILKKCNSFYLEISLLGSIIYDLKSSINFRKSFYSKSGEEEETCEKNSHFFKQPKKERISASSSKTVMTVIINESKTYEDILKYFKMAELQLTVCQFFIEQNATFSNDYDITSSEEKAVYVSAQLILNHEYELMKQVKEVRKLSLMNILFKACDLLNKESFDRIKEFMSSLSKEQAYLMLQAFSMSNDRQNILLLICECFERSEQCFLFLEYNFIAESFALALEFNNKDIISLIGYKAAILGDVGVVNQCNKILNIR